jgi:ABC-2 type transport system ATP-binding protein
MIPAISTTNLTKVYRLPRGVRKTAVESLTLEVKQAEIFGFLGPNGAGKTTTIKMLLGFVKPTAGSAQIMGIPIDRTNARADIGYLPEQPYFHKFMTAREIISMHAALIGIKRSERKQKIDEVIEQVGLEEIARTPASKLSKGQVQRIGIAQALIGSPSLLILDEPTSGLDPLGRQQIRDLLLDLNRQGKTIFLSSHLLSEVETICSRIAVLVKGRMAAIGTPNEIKRGGERTAITVAGELPSELIVRLGYLSADIAHSEGETVITVESHQIYELIDTIREYNLPLVSVMPIRETLEEAFLRLAA